MLCLRWSTYMMISLVGLDSATAWTLEPFYNGGHRLRTWLPIRCCRTTTSITSKYLLRRSLLHATQVCNLSRDWYALLLTFIQVDSAVLWCQVLPVLPFTTCKYDHLDIVSFSIAKLLHILTFHLTTNTYTNYSNNHRHMINLQINTSYITLSDKATSLLLDI